MPGRFNSSSVDGGIFAEQPVQIPQVKINTVGQHNSSSLQGGIFAEPAAFQATPRTSQMTTSSVQGGIFADGGASQVKDMRPKTASRHRVTDNDAVAGKKLERDNHDSAALQPLRSARANQNSVDGGIFSGQAPTPIKQRGATCYRNASSVPGGIFG
eukprot:CAMPEP_0119077590 /NCGR_PEP_ID=MMETSP1178-20130426/95568_1 /TAXON_ID=33656 /ORGANISM="unid sp, Strain CCMP2000" /LENGTH=156 /DNA_ID=CAMNT_0007059961 /DNA_START=44 /DNA_END=514 /DNA_ORIENTATION=+